MEYVINRDAYALLAVTEAERAPKLYLIRKTVFLDKTGKLSYYLT